MIYSIIIGDLFTDLAAAAAVAHVGPVPVTRRAATAAAPLTALGDARGVSSPPERAREAPQLSTSNSCKHFYKHFYKHCRSAWRSWSERERRP